MDREQLYKLIKESNGQTFVSIDLCHDRIAEIERYVVESMRKDVMEETLSRPSQKALLNLLDIWIPQIKWTVEVQEDRNECVLLKSGCFIPNPKISFLLRITSSVEEIVDQGSKVVNLIKGLAGEQLLKEGNTLKALLRDLHTRLYMGLPRENVDEYFETKLKQLILRNFNVRIIEAENVSDDFRTRDYFDCSTSTNVTNLTTTVPAIIASDNTCLCKGLYVLPLLKEKENEPEGE